MKLVCEDAPFAFKHGWLHVAANLMAFPHVANSLRTTNLYFLRFLLSCCCSGSFNLNICIVSIVYMCNNNNYNTLKCCERLVCLNYKICCCCCWLRMCAIFEYVSNCIFMHTNTHICVCTWVPALGCLRALHSGADLLLHVPHAMPTALTATSMW